MADAGAAAAASADPAPPAQAHASEPAPMVSCCSCARRPLTTRQEVEPAQVAAAPAAAAVAPPAAVPAQPVERAAAQAHPQATHQPPLRLSSAAAAAANADEFDEPATPTSSPWPAAVARWEGKAVRAAHHALSPALVNHSPSCPSCR
jgi:hypothetical protein